MSSPTTFGALLRQLRKRAGMTQGDLAAARPYFERALQIREQALGPAHPDTQRVRANQVHDQAKDGKRCE